jgi:hypothetical protein
VKKLERALREARAAAERLEGVDAERAAAQGRATASQVMSFTGSVLLGRCL